MIRKLFLTIILVSFFHIVSLSQEEIYPFEKWEKKDQLIRANNFDGVTYMDSVEKEILLYCNLVRINPKLFAETYYQKYLDLTDNKMTNSYIASLYNRLIHAKKGMPLFADENLFKMAKDHAITTGEKGTTGHAMYTKRIKTFLGEDYLPVGENCSYGYNDALGVFMQLMIDEDTPSFGHRENILDPNFNVVGISIQKHAKYSWTCVMEFGYLPITE